LLGFVNNYLKIGTKTKAPDLRSINTERERERERERVPKGNAPREESKRGRNHEGEERVFGAEIYL
jgi:hypothetical protein